MKKTMTINRALKAYEKSNRLTPKSFTMMLLRKVTKANKKIPTCGLHKGFLLINPDFIKTKTEEQVVFLIEHEIMHLINMLLFKIN